MKIKFKAERLECGYYILSYRRWLFWWYTIGDEVHGNFSPKQFSSLDAAMDYAAEVGREIATK